MADSGLRDRSVTPRDYEVHVTVYGRDDDEKSSYAIQRAPDSSGSPDVGNAEIVGRVAAGGGTFVDRPPNLDGHYYRAREEREGYDDSAWTDWTRRYRGKMTPVEDAVPSPRRSIGANTDRDTGGVTVRDVVSRIRDSGNAGPTMGQFDGAQSHVIARGVIPGDEVDGEAVSYSDSGVTFQNPPQVFFGFGGVVTATGLSGQYGPRVRAKNATAAGFDLEAKLVELVGTLTPRTASFSSGHGSGPPWQAENADGAAWDDRYIYRYSLTLDPDSFATVEFYANDGSGWEQVASRGFLNEDPVNPVTHSSQTQEVVKEGVGPGTGNQFGMDVDFGSTSGSLTPNQVEWNTATDPAEEPMTPSGSAPIPWIAVGK